MSTTNVGSTRLSSHVGATTAKVHILWEVYGSSKGAIIVTADADELSTFIKKEVGDDASSGPVRYGFKTSNVRPEFIASIHDRSWDEDYDLFFHKHEFYEFEKEFRAVIFGQTEGVKLELPDQMVKGITISPVAPLDSSLLAGLKNDLVSAFKTLSSIGHYPHRRQ